MEFRGTMTDCPDRLTTGATLMVTLHVYVISTAFKPAVVKPYNAPAEDAAKIMFDEGRETQAEQSVISIMTSVSLLIKVVNRILRERKNSILKLFDVVGLRPQSGANFSGRKSEEQVQEEALKRIAQRKSKKVTEIVGDGEEIEVEDSEDLSKNDLDMIYERQVLRLRALDSC